MSSEADEPSALSPIVYVPLPLRCRNRSSSVCFDHLHWNPGCLALLPECRNRRVRNDHFKTRFASLDLERSVQSRQSVFRINSDAAPGDAVPIMFDLNNPDHRIGSFRSYPIHEAAASAPIRSARASSANRPFMLLCHRCRPVSFRFCGICDHDYYRCDVATVYSDSPASKIMTSSASSVPSCVSTLGSSDFFSNGTASSFKSAMALIASLISTSNSESARRRFHASIASMHWDVSQFPVVCGSLSMLNAFARAPHVRHFTKTIKFPSQGSSKSVPKAARPPQNGQFPILFILFITSPECTHAHIQNLRSTAPPPAVPHPR